jgi:hypothetical protein
MRALGASCLEQSIISNCFLCKPTTQLGAHPVLLTRPLGSMKVRLPSRIERLRDSFSMTSLAELRLSLKVWP